jgi:Fe-Mn family superoxide dismutase
MHRRAFIQTSSLAAAGALLLPNLAFAQSAENPEDQLRYPYELPQLPFGYEAMEPVIDVETMEIHHSRHHAGYVDKLNAALASNTEMQALPLVQLMQGFAPDTPAAIRNNAGGHYNHSLFWDILRPNPADGGVKPSGEIAGAIDVAFGDYGAFHDAFSKAAMGVFGSGWAWLCVMPDKLLKILTTPNQDNPLMEKLVKESGTPILALDVWEHAYYLHYQNRRKDYVESFFACINWDRVAERYTLAIQG